MGVGPQGMCDSNSSPPPIKYLRTCRSDLGSCSRPAPPPPPHNTNFVEFYLMMHLDIPSEVNIHTGAVSINNILSDKNFLFRMSKVIMTTNTAQQQHPCFIFIQQQPRKGSLPIRVFFSSFFLFVLAHT